MMHPRLTSAQDTPDLLAPGQRVVVETAFLAGWLAPGMKVLELGCREGERAAWLAVRGFTMTGVDRSESAIEAAIAMYDNAAPLEFQVGDVAEAGTLRGRSFDAVVDCSCLWRLARARRSGYARNVRSWVRPGGTLLLALPDGAAAAEPFADVFEPLTPDFEVTGTRKLAPTEDAAAQSLFRMRRLQTAQDTPAGLWPIA